MLCRLFYSRAEFEEEVALYRDPALACIMPDLLHADNNNAGTVRSRSGYAFPPFLVIERGTTLLTWLAEQRNFFEVSTMVEALARLLDSLHAAGYVHRDVKVRRSAALTTLGMLPRGYPVLEVVCADGMLMLER